MLPKAAVPIMDATQLKKRKQTKKATTKTGLYKSMGYCNASYT